MRTKEISILKLSLKDDAKSCLVIPNGQDVWLQFEVDSRKIYMNSNHFIDIIKNELSRFVNPKSRESLFPQ